MSNYYQMLKIRIKLACDTSIKGPNIKANILQFQKYHEEINLR